MSKPSRLKGWFAVPAEHMDELRALEDKAREARRKPGRKPRYTGNPLFDRARALARTSAVFEPRGHIFLAMHQWYEDRFNTSFPDTVTDPDKRNTLIPRLLVARDEEVAAWVREHPEKLSDTDPAYIVECIRAMLRVFTYEPAERLCIINASHTEQPAPEKDDLLGWFAVPAAHMPELHALWAEAREALIARRDRHCYEPRNRLFERARAVATEAAVFPWYPATRYQDANFILWDACKYVLGLEAPPGPVIDPDRRKALAKALGGVPTRRVTNWVRKHEAWYNDNRDVEPKVVGELFKALGRVLGSPRKRGLGLVKTWWTFEDRDQAYKDEDTRREVMPIVHALRATREEAEARHDKAAFGRADAEIDALIQTHPWVPGELLEEELDRRLAEDLRARMYAEAGWDLDESRSR